MRPTERMLVDSEQRDGKLIVVDVRILRIELDVEALDGPVRHLHVEVVRVAEGGGRVYVGDRGGRIRPRVEGVLVAAYAGAVAVFPPDFRGVVVVYHHGVGVRTGAPRVAAYAGVDVFVRPGADFCPGVWLAGIPDVLLEGGLVACEPEVYAGGAVKGDLVCFAVGGGELLVVRVAVEAALVAGLETDAGVA